MLRFGGRRLWRARPLPPSPWHKYAFGEPAHAGGLSCLLADLTPKQQRFVDEYLVDLNATQAAIRAGYSEKSAYSQAHDLLKKPEIEAAVAAARLEQSDRTGVTADRVIRELAAIAFGDLRDVASWRADALTLIDSAELAPEAAAAVREVVAYTTTTDHGESSTTTTRVQIRQHDKIAAIRLLGQHLGLFKETLKLEHAGLGDVFEAIRRRARGEDE